MNPQTTELLTTAGTIVAICALFATGFLALLNRQERHTKERLDALAETVQGLKESLAEAPSAPKEIHISIVGPRDWRPRESEREKGKAFKLPLSFSGLARGPIGAAYLAYRPVEPAGHYRVVDALLIKDGAWTGTAILPSWERGLKFELVAIAFAAKIEISNNVRILVDDAVLSNHIPIEVPFK